MRATTAYSYSGKSLREKYIPAFKYHLIFSKWHRTGILETNEHLPLSILESLLSCTSGTKVRAEGIRCDGTAVWREAPTDKGPRTSWDKAMDDEFSPLQA